jgi:hypothetical protein
MDDFLEESKLTEQDMEKWAHEHNRVQVREIMYDNN